MAGLLDPEFLTRLDYLYIVAKEGYLTNASAHRVSQKFGVGLEYADHREYAAGDDFRYIDWQVYARLDKLVVKLFSEEQELAIYLLVDASKSMERGGKLRYAKQVAAALGYIAVNNLDRVVVVPFDGQLRMPSTSFTGRGRRLDLLQFLEGLEPDGQTNLERAISAFLGRFKRRGLVILASDFLDPGYAKALRLLHHNGFDCLMLQVNERAEVDPPLKGDVELVDCETGEAVAVRLTPAVRQIYLEEWNAHYAELRRISRAFHQGHIEAVSDTSFEDLVLGIFRRTGFLR